jgi:signal transduction histidine kinase
MLSGKITMRLTPLNSKDSFRLIALGLIGVVALASIGMAMYFGTSSSRQMHRQLSERSQSIAAALGSSQVSKLQGTSNDGDTQTYKALKAQLADIKRANPDARSMYLMGRHHGRLFFYVDSEQPSSPDYSPAGDWYDDGTDADVHSFDIGKPFVEGPTSDSYGTFISGLAPIYKPNGQVQAVLGIDVDAHTYYRDIFYAASIPLAVGFSIILIIVVFEFIRRRNQQLLALRSELVSVASHELRNPITGIRWAADSLQRMSGDDLQTRLSRAIYQSAVRLQASTDDILEISHAMNQRALDIKPVDMSKLMREVLDTQSLSAEQKGVHLLTDPTWPPQLILKCDADQMKRALHNIVSNAIKYTKQGTNVTVAYKQDNTMHHLLVSDQGIGIPVGEQAKVFRGFYRASNAVASSVTGTGLGLYLVKTVLERQGGSVSFVSEESHGTTFSLNLPKR